MRRRCEERGSELYESSVAEAGDGDWLWLLVIKAINQAECQPASLRRLKTSILSQLDFPCN